MNKYHFNVIVFIFLLLSTGCEEEGENICIGYSEAISGKTYNGSISIDSSGITSQVPVTVDLNIFEDSITIDIFDSFNMIYNSAHRFRCSSLENETIPLIEILDNNNFVIGCIVGDPTSVLNYEIEIIPNALITTATTNL